MANKNVDEMKLELTRLMHGVQSGVLMEIELLGEAEAAANPKHLRVGVNSTMVETGALAHLLVQKGVFTEAEYYESLVLMWGNELDRYERRLTQKMGKQVRLL